MATREWPHLTLLSPGVARLAPRRASNAQQAAGLLRLPCLPADAAEELHLVEDTRKVLARLTRREEQILRLRFGIGTHSSQTLEQVGRRFAVTQERIQQVEARAIRKLRSPSRTRSPERPLKFARVN